MNATTARGLDLTCLAFEVVVEQLTRPRPGALLDRLDRAGSRALRVDVAALLREIDRHVAPYRRFELDRCARVRAWATAMLSLDDAETLEAVLAQAQQWVRRAGLLLEDQR